MGMTGSVTCRLPEQGEEVGAIKVEMNLPAFPRGDASQPQSFGSAFSGTDGMLLPPPSKPAQGTPLFKRFWVAADGPSFVLTSQCHDHDARNPTKGHEWGDKDSGHKGSPPRGPPRPHTKAREAEPCKPNNARGKKY